MKTAVPGQLHIYRASSITLILPRPFCVVTYHFPPALLRTRPLDRCGFGVVLFKAKESKEVKLDLLLFMDRRTTFWKDWSKN